MQNHLLKKLSLLYAQMEEEYDHVAGKIGLSCHGCPDNCCNSYFQHHTHIEWAYLWKGMEPHSDEEQRELVNKAGEHITKSQALLAQGLRPRIMSPLNDNGLCQLYEYRLMICRMHGVPSSFVRPDGKSVSFPGCFRFQELSPDLEEVPILERTRFYQELASLEIAFAGSKGKGLSKVNLTLAEMLVKGPPRL